MPRRGKGTAGSSAGAEDVACEVSVVPPVEAVDWVSWALELGNSALALDLNYPGTAGVRWYGPWIKAG